MTPAEEYATRRGLMSPEQVAAEIRRLKAEKKERLQDWSFEAIEEAARPFQGMAWLPLLEPRDMDEREREVYLAGHPRWTVDERQAFRFACGAGQAELFEEEDFEEAEEEPEEDPMLNLMTEVYALQRAILQGDFDEDDEEEEDPAWSGSLARLAQDYLNGMVDDHVFPGEWDTPPLIRLAMALHAQDDVDDVGGPSKHLHAVAFAHDYPTAADLYAQASGDPLGLARLAQERTVGVLVPDLSPRAAIRAAARELVLALQANSFD